MYNQQDLFPVVIAPTTPILANLVVVDNKIDKKTGRLRTIIEADTSTMNIPLITKEVYAKAFLRSAVEYMGNDVSAVFDELKLVYARMQAIAEANRISDEKGHPMGESQFNSLVGQNLWMINHIMSGKGELDRLHREFKANRLHDEADAVCASFPEPEQGKNGE